MDLKKQNYIVEAEDRISELPDSLIHHTLFSLDIKRVARTSVLSKRWKCIWTSIPTLVFPFWSRLEPPSLSETNKFMEFVDRTLLLHDITSNIQKFHLQTNGYMTSSRVHSWIQNLIMRNVQELDLSLDQEKPCFIPMSLFTCESLITLELMATYGYATPFPKRLAFPKLKSLTLCGFQFTDDGWNEQQFVHCPVLEKLDLEDCSWFGVKNFCISTPTLKVLNIVNTPFADDCALKIHAPNLVSLDYAGCVAKEYVLSSFQKLEFATVLLTEYGILREQPR